MQIFEVNFVGFLGTCFWYWFDFWLRYLFVIYSDQFFILRRVVFCFFYDNNDSTS